MRIDDILTPLRVTKVTIYSWIKSGIFPPSIPIGLGSVAWLESEVNAVLSARVRGATNAQIQTIVAQIIRDRKDFKFGGAV